MERQQDYGLKRHGGNGMVQRGWGKHEDDEEPKEEHSDLFLLAVELSRADWARIKAEKGGLMKWIYLATYLKRIGPS